MPWPRPTIDTIYERIKADMESRVTNGNKIPRVSMLGVMALTFAGALHLTYGFLVWLADQIFPDTASSVGLERWANILKLPREAATFTTGTVSFTGTADYVVLTGREIVSSDGYTYTTQADYTINPASSPVEVEATGEGALYNSDDATMELSSPDGNVDTTVTVTSGFNDGQDLETTENWILRLLARFQNPPSSGNAGDYERWAREAVAEVGRSWCIPQYAGDGTVATVVATSDLEAVSAQTVTDVGTYIDAAKPIPADHTTLNADPVPVVYEVALSSSDTALQDQIETNLQELHLLEAGPGTNFRIPFSHVTSAIAAAGPYDYEVVDIQVDSVSIGLTDIETVAPQIPVFNSVTFSAI